jgi:hypothetical protein
MGPRHRRHLRRLRRAAPQLTAAPSCPRASRRNAVDSRLRRLAPASRPGAGTSPTCARACTRRPKRKRGSALAGAGRDEVRARCQCPACLHLVPTAASRGVPGGPLR